MSHPSSGSTRSAPASGMPSPSPESAMSPALTASRPTGPAPLSLSLPQLQPHPSSAASLASLYPAPTPPLPETPHPLHAHIEAISGPFSPNTDLNTPQQEFPSSAVLDSAMAAARAGVAAVQINPPAPRVAWRRKLVLVLVGLPARGKCWGRGTQMLMHDGSVRAVEHIVAAHHAGEAQLLMGDDCTPRRVVCAYRGNTADDAEAAIHDEPQPNAPKPLAAATYRITNDNKDLQSWTCNSEHILVLQLHKQPQVQQHGDAFAIFAWRLQNVDGHPVPHMEQHGQSYATHDEAAAALRSWLKSEPFVPLEWEVPVGAFMRYDPVVQRCCRMFTSARVSFPALDESSGEPRSLHARLQRVMRELGVLSADQQPSQQMVLDTAWVLAMWMVHGKAGSAAIEHTSSDAIHALQQWATAVGGVSKEPAPTASESDVVPSELLPSTVVELGSVMLGLLESYKLREHKHCPRDLLLESGEVRARLLAGLVDASGGEFGADGRCELVSTDQRLLADAAFLARSLGCGVGAVSERGTVASKMADEPPSFCVSIDASDVALDTVLASKRDMVRSEQRSGALSRASSFTCERVDHADYFGFTVSSLDGSESNGRFLMSDLVVTHNSYIAYKLMGYLRWRGLNASLFNVGRHRRQVAEVSHAPQSSDYFSPDNKSAAHQRDEIAMEVLDCMLDWLAQSGDVAIFDATNCFDAADHELFTSVGWLSLDGVLSHFKQHQTLDVGCYVDGALVFKAIHRSDVTIAEGEFQFVRFESASSTDGANQAVSLVATDNHRMYGRLGASAHANSSGQSFWHKEGQVEQPPPYAVHQAKEVVQKGSEHEHACFQLQSLFERGVVTESDVLPFVEPLGLTTEDRIDAFLWLYGYWLGGGWLDMNSGGVCFGTKKAKDMDQLDAVFQRLPLQQLAVGGRGQNGYWRADNLSNGQRNYCIYAPAWWELFAGQYGHKHESAAAELPDAEPQPSDAEAIASAKCFFWWVFKRLHRARLDTLLSGLRFADGAESKASESESASESGGHIFTSSSRFAAEIDRVCLMAGYSTRVTRRDEEDSATTHGVNQQGATTVARKPGWVVHYTTASCSAQVKLVIGAEVHAEEKKRQAKVWCVSVPTEQQLIMVRRVLRRDAAGEGVDFSRGVVVGNTTSARRLSVLQRCQGRSTDLRVIFLESICDDKRVLELNYRVKAMNSPDYKNMPLEEALSDLRMRVANYEKIYESINDDELSYIKLHNLASKVICNKIHGALSHAIAAYLMSIHIQPRPIFFVRAGHSESERGEAEIPGQQSQDRQILRLPDTSPPSSAADSSASASASAPAPSSSSPSVEYHIPYSVAMAANLDTAGKAFAKRLDQFITHKVEQYMVRTMEHGVPTTPTAPHMPITPDMAAAAEAEAGKAEEHAHAHAHPAPPASSNLSPPVVVDAAAGGAAAAAASSCGCTSPPDHHLPLVVYTSTLPRAIQTAQCVKDRAYTFEAQSALNMMDTGACSGMSIDEIRDKMPEELDKWKKHRYRYRFPAGESQADRAKTLEPLVFELERQTLPVLVVSHMSTLQVLLGFFYGSKRSVDSYYSLWLPQHVVLELIPHQYGWLEIRHDLSEEACAEADGSADYTQSPARSPRSPAVPMELGAQAADEQERFNLQVVQQSGSNSKAKGRAQAKAAALAGAAASSSSSTLLPPRALISHDRSISIPVHTVPPSPLSVGGVRIGSPPSAGDAQYRKGSIGRSSGATVLGETNFYEADK